MKNILVTLGVLAVAVMLAVSCSCSGNKSKGGEADALPAADTAKTDDMNFNPAYLT